MAKITCYFKDCHKNVLCTMDNYLPNKMLIQKLDIVDVKGRNFITLTVQGYQYLCQTHRNHTLTLDQKQHRQNKIDTLYANSKGYETFFKEYSDVLIQIGFNKDGQITTDCYGHLSFFQDKNVGMWLRDGKMKTFRVSDYFVRGKLCPVPVAPPLPNSAPIPIKTQPPIPSAAPIPSAFNDKEVNERKINLGAVYDNKLLKDFEDNYQLLVFGFIRKNAFGQYGLFITSSIVGVVLLYAFQQGRLKWVHISEETSFIKKEKGEWAFVSEDGRTVHCPSHGNNEASWKGPRISVSTNIGWNVGVHSWKIQMVKRASFLSKPAEQVGVTTNPNATIWHYSSPISWYYDSDMEARAIVCGHRHVDIKNGVGKWNNGDVIEIVLDCNNWRMSWYLNEVKLITHNIIPDKKYYPFICFRTAMGYKFKLL